MLNASSSKQSSHPPSHLVRCPDDDLRGHPSFRVTTAARGVAPYPTLWGRPSLLPPRRSTNMFTHPPEQVLAFSGCRYPHWFKVRARPTSELDVGVQAAAVRIWVKVKKRLAAQVEVWPIASATRHVIEAVDGPQRLDQFGVCHTAHVLDHRDTIGQWGTRPGTRAAVNGIVGAHRGPSLRRMKRLHNPPHIGGAGQVTPCPISSAFGY